MINLKIFDIRADGSLNISVEKHLDKTIPDSKTWYTSKGYSIVALVMLSLIDIVGFWQIANITLSESTLNKLLIISAFAIAFEIAPLYIGYGICLKCYGLGKPIHNWVLVFSTVACVLGVGTNILYRIQTVNIAYWNYLSNSVEKIGMPLTIVMCILPIITSLINLVIGCLSFDPLLFDLLRIEKRLRTLKIRKRQTIASKETLINNADIKIYLLKEEQKCFSMSKLQIETINLNLKNYVIAKCPNSFGKANQR